jgi:hypothetical protein
MNRTFPPRGFALVALLALAAAVVAAGCAKKMTSVDPGFTKLEGVPDNRAIIMVYPEQSYAASVWQDKGDKGVDLPGSVGENGDVRIDTTLARNTGVLRVLLLDGTNASGFELYRTATNGGLQRIGDFLVGANRKWLDTHWEAYVASFVARGLLSGVAGPSSPVSAPTTPSTAMFTPNIAYLDSLTPSDSLFRMSWSPVPGAAGYWLQVYTFSPRATLEEQRRSGQPSPIWNGNVTNNLVAYVTGATTYKLGAPGALVLTFTPPVRNRQYRVRVTAVDATGRVIGYLKSRDFLDDGIAVGDSTYVRVPLASVTVNPRIRNPRYDHDFGN